MLRRFMLGLGLIVVWGSQAPSAWAQGLIWNAPPEGTEVQYEGDYTQEDERPNSVDKRIKLEWRRRLWIRALKKTTAAYKGKDVDCQWFEIEVHTGTETGDGNIVLGPGGKRAYKILVPLENAPIGPPVDGKVVDKQGIPVAYLPIVKGFRRIDEQPPTPIASGVFDTYPMLTLLAHYRDLELTAEDVDPKLDAKLNISTAQQYHGELTTESPTNRFTNKADITVNDSVPFGLVRWQAEVVREVKDGKAARDQFQPSSTFRVGFQTGKDDMRIVSIGTVGSINISDE